MEKDNKLFADCSKLFGSAANTAFGMFADMKENIENIVADKIDFILKKRNIVTREEFEIVRKMAQTARENQEKLAAELAELKKNNEKK